jgi:hypothetical protein
MTGNPIRDKVPVDFYSRSNDDDTGTTGESHLQEPVKEGLLSRVAPETRLGWILAFIATVTTIALVSWSWQYVPPVAKTLEAALVVLLGGSNLVNWLVTRQSMLSYWGDYDHVDLYQGDHVTPKVGRIRDADGEDPLFEELETPGFAGLRPQYRRVDDEFATENALMSKLDRRVDPQTDEWEPSKGRLDHAYLGDGDIDYLGQRLVVHCSDTDPTPYAPGYEWTTVPPMQPDMDAMRKLRDRDYLLRNHVIPTIEEEKTTMRNRLEKVKNASMDEPILAMNEIPDLLQSLLPVIAAQNDGELPGELAPEPDMNSEIDDRAEDRLDDT